MCLFQILVWEQKSYKLAQTQGIELILLGRYKPSAIAVKYLCAAKAFLLLFSAPFVTFPNEREIKGQAVKNTCSKALQELEFLNLL